MLMLLFSREVKQIWLFVVFGLIIGACGATPVPTPTLTPTVLPTSTPTLIPSPTPDYSIAVGTDIFITLPPGDPEAGAKVVSLKGCLACHKLAPVGPLWVSSEELPGIGARAELRIAQEDYTGNATSAQQYLFESVVLPDAYVVSGFPASLMLSNLSNELSIQQLSDLIAYLLAIE